jgi:shikimate 5-dehydrogenase
VRESLYAIQDLIENRLPPELFSKPAEERFLFGAIVGGRQPSRYAESPLLWNEYARMTGIPLLYAALDLPDSAGLDPLFGIMAAEPRFCELTVTDPYKMAAFRSLRSLAGFTADGEVTALESFNHLIRTHSSGLRAMNTDGKGMVRSIAAHTGLEGRRALIIGAGGAARSIGYELLKAGCRLHIGNAFDAERAECVSRLAGSFPAGDIESSDFSRLDTAAGEAQILINTVAEGCPKEILLAQLKDRRPLIAESLYGGKEQFREFAAEQGLIYVGGREMLFGQFEIAAEELALTAPASTQHRQAMAELRKLSSFPT